MRRVSVMGYSKPFPLRDIVLRDVRIVRRIRSITSEIGNDTHRTNTDNAFQREVGLIAVKIVLEYFEVKWMKETLRQSSGKIICRDLISWRDGV